MSTWLSYLVRHKWKALLAILLLAGVGYYWFGRETATVSTTAAPRTEAVKKGDLSVTVSGSGQIEADSQVDLKAVRAGDGVDVVSVLVKNDDYVKKNQVIAVLDGSDAARSLEQAKLSLQSAEIRLKQTADVSDKQTERDRWTRQLQEISVSQSRLLVADATEKLADYTIRAPFDGIVTGLDIAAGDSLANDMVIASVITAEMKVKVTLNEVDAVNVSTGSVAHLTFDALPGLALTGRVTKLDTIGVTSQNVVSYGAEITLDEQQAKLKPGMSVSAEIVVAEKQGVILVPTEAITTQDGVSTVTVVSGSRGQSDGADARPKTERRTVVTGISNDTDTEIVSGLAEHDRILTTTTAGQFIFSGRTSNSGTPSIFNLLRGGGGGRPTTH